MATSPLALAKIAGFAVKVGTVAVQRWTAYRQNQFLESLLENLQIEHASGDRRSEVDEALDKLLESEEGSEILYDAYRRVCFTRSKNYGPRIIGLLTAELLNNSSTSNEDDEMIFDAAERMSDVQLVDFKHAFAGLIEESQSAPTRARKVLRRGDEISETEEFSRMESGTEGSTEMIPPDLRDTHGAWAARLNECGIVSRTVEQRTKEVKEDGERHIDYDQTWFFFSWVVTYRDTALRLYNLLLRARREGDE
jgi:hypothetical protein